MTEQGVLSAWLSAWEVARDEYLAVHPSPSVLDFTCPRCRAVPGQACRGRPAAIEHGHAPRQDKALKARRLRNLDAANDANNRAYRPAGDTQRYRTDRHIAYLRRHGASPVNPTKE